MRPSSPPDEANRRQPHEPGHREEPPQPDAVPAVLLEHIESWRARFPEAALAARAAMDEAVRLGDGRPGAWPLLAADALATEASEQALDESDVEDHLRRVVQALAGP